MPRTRVQIWIMRQRLSSSIASFEEKSKSDKNKSVQTFLLVEVFLRVCFSKLQVMDISNLIGDLKGGIDLTKEAAAFSAACLTDPKLMEN